MILTCPNCATRYFAPPEVTASRGRRLKCSECGEVWQNDPAPADMPSFRFIAPTPEPITPEPTLEPTQIDETQVLETDSAPLFTARLSKARPAKKRRGVLGVGIGLTLVVAVITSLVVFRAPIMHNWPATAKIYSAAGLNP